MRHPLIVTLKAGYLEWAKDDVMVVAGKCHVETVTLQANLEPAPGCGLRAG